MGGNFPPPNTYSAALARGLPSKGEMRRASIHEQYDVGMGGRLGSNIPPNTYSAALARGLPSKGEMRRTSIHEQYDVGIGGAGGANGRLGRKHPPGPLQRGRCDGQAYTNNMM